MLFSYFEDFNKLFLDFFYNPQMVQNLSVLSLAKKHLTSSSRVRETTVLYGEKMKSALLVTENYTLIKILPREWAVREVKQWWLLPWMVSKIWQHKKLGVVASGSWGNLSFKKLGVQINWTIWVALLNFCYHFFSWSIMLDSLGCAGV